MGRLMLSLHLLAFFASIAFLTYLGRYIYRVLGDEKKDG